MFSLSVVVISKNEEAYITRSLQSVLAAAEKIGGAEIVVVDSASTDRTVEMARSFGVRVLSLRPEWGLSPAAGRYVGFHHTSGELVMFVDADTVIDREWLQAARRYFALPEVAGVAGYLDDVDEKGQLLPYVGHRSAEVCVVDRLRGIALYRRAAMERAGTFNPYLITEEEAELGFRLRQHGFRLLQVPHPMGRHLRGTSAHTGLLRAWRLGRFKGDGLTLRYGWRAGKSLRFCFDLMRPTIVFLAVCSLLVVGLGLFLAGYEQLGRPMLLLFLGLMVAIAIKRRSLLGPVTYVITHLLILSGLISGAFTTTIKDPQSYPLDVISH